MTDLILIEKNPKIRQKYRISLITHTNYWVGICEQMRFIYDSIHDMENKELKERLIEQLVDALIMGKKMADRLNYYHKKYQDTTGHKGANLVALTHNASRIRMRRARKV